MKEKIGEAYADVDGIQVETYSVLTAEFARAHDAKFLLRGLRNTTDFEYENSIAQVNLELYQDLETVFLITSPVYAFISSSIIREVHRYGGDISKYIPYDLPGQ
jgi:pantetheine-phosphate adenylyltransferase